MSAHSGLRIAGMCAAILAGAGVAHIRAASDIELQYDEALTKIGFPNPLLRGRIRGTDAWFIVDTGAGVHTLAAWVVRAAGIPTEASGSTTTGSTGATSVVRAASGEVIRRTDRSDITLRQAIVVDLPPVFEQQRIAGLLSPQLLAPAGDAAVLDMTAPRLSFRRDDAPNAPPAAGVCVNRDSPYRNRLYSTAVTVDGVAGTLLVDTGATRTIVAAPSAIAKALSPRASDGATTQGVGGSATSMRQVSTASVIVGGASATLPLMIGRAAPSCGADGLLGMDALRRCVLVLGESSFAIDCRDGVR
ncbi:MAG TPA: retropepsin-like aspartic protease [Vicinamibacterales bacterium]|nr:retropepsin-like aspartic protease [Vicinamibacterales bacterium]